MPISMIPMLQAIIEGNQIQIKTADLDDWMNVRLSKDKTRFEGWRKGKGWRTMPIGGTGVEWRYPAEEKDFIA